MLSFDTLRQFNQLNYFIGQFINSSTGVKTNFKILIIIFQCLEFTD